MANNETIADIVEEMRNRAEAARQYDDGIVMLLNTLADRIETVYKRETVEVSTRAATFAINKTNEEWRQKLGNAAKLREAAVKIIDYLEPIRKWTMPTQENGTELTALFAAIDTVYQMAKAALAAPARECDVGTAEEQSRRFCAFCRPRTEPCDGCACLEGSRKGRCEFVWAQMPCNESGAAK